MAVEMYRDVNRPGSAAVVGSSFPAEPLTERQATSSYVDPRSSVDSRQTERSIRRPRSSNNSVVELHPLHNIQTQLEAFGKHNPLTRQTI